jgi:hypothetical protein
MNRRTFLETTAVLLATERAQRNTQALSGRCTPLRDDELSVIETRLCTLRPNRSSGNLVGIAWKDPRLEIIREPRLGENFRILLPLTDYESNHFLSSNQTVEIEQIADGVVCHYNSLRNSREAVQASVHYQIQALEDHVGFSILIENPTDLPLAEVYFAIVGGQQGLQDRRETESLVPGLNLNLAPGLFSFHAGNYGGGNLGIRYEAAGFTYPGLMQMGWIVSKKDDLGANHIAIR